MDEAFIIYFKYTILKIGCANKFITKGEIDDELILIHQFYPKFSPVIM